MRPLKIFMVAVLSLPCGFSVAQPAIRACPTAPVIQLPGVPAGRDAYRTELDCLSQKLLRLERENELTRAQLFRLVPASAQDPKGTGTDGKHGGGLFQDMTFKDWVAVVTSIIGITFIPFTLLGIWRGRVVSQNADNWKSRQEEIGTYNDINSKYSDFLQTLLANSDVDVGEFDTPRPLKTDAERYKRMTMYAILVVLMERAYLLYNAIKKFDEDLQKSRKQRTWLVVCLDKVEELLFGGQPKHYETHIVVTQWDGWVKYFDYYCGHEAFQEYWKSTVTGETSGIATMWQDKKFENFVNKRIAKATGSAMNNLQDD